MIKRQYLFRETKGINVNFLNQCIRYVPWWNSLAEIENSYTMIRVEISRSFPWSFLVDSSKKCRPHRKHSVAGGLFSLVDFGPKSADTKSGTLIHHKLSNLALRWKYNIGCIILDTWFCACSCILRDNWLCACFCILNELFARARVFFMNLLCDNWFRACSCLLYELVYTTLRVLLNKGHTVLV